MVIDDFHIVEQGWSTQEVANKNSQIERVREGLGVSEQYLYKLNFPTSQLDQSVLVRLLPVF